LGAPVRRRRTTVEEVVEFLLLIGTEQRADRLLQLALFPVEAFARVTVNSFKAAAPLFEEFSDLLALRGIELDLARQALEQLGRQRRSARPAAEERSTAGAARAAAAKPVSRGPIGRSHPSDAHGWEETSGHKTRRSAKEKDDEDEEAKPHSRAVIGHGFLP
jgi:hypothetical protein